MIAEVLRCGEIGNSVEKRIHRMIRDGLKKGIRMKKYVCNNFNCIIIIIIITEDFLCLEEFFLLL